MGFGGFFLLGVETELGSVNEAGFYFCPCDNCAASGQDDIKSPKVSHK